MAQIAYLHHEDVTRALVEAALQTREIGFTGASGYEELIIKSESGSFYHFASLERLDDHAASVSSGAALIGFAPPGGMSSVNVQAAIEELLGLVGGGSVVGTGTTGKLAVWVSGSTVGNSSILSEASNKLLFSGDSAANFYRSAASTMKTDGALQVAGLLTALANLNVVSTLTFAGDAAASLTKFGSGQLLAGQDLIVPGNLYPGNSYVNDQITANRISTGNFVSTFAVIDNTSPDQTYQNKLLAYFAKSNSNTRKFFGTLIMPTINNTAGNSNTTVEVLAIDTVNTSLTGTTVNLLHIYYGGADRVTVDSFGNVTSAQGDFRAGRDVIAQSGLYGASISVGFSPVANLITAPTNGFKHNLISAYFQKNNSTTVEHSLLSSYALLDAGASNANETVNLIHADTLAIGASTGMTINCLKLCIAGVEKFRVNSSGDIIGRYHYNSAISDGYLIRQAGGRADESSVATDLLGRIGVGGALTNAMIYILSATPGSADLEFDVSTDTPSNPQASLGSVKMYYRGNKIVFVVDDGGTVRYKYLDLSGTGVTWVHTTTAV